jgi:uncharacterized protein YndB with AHSA1/START domain
VEDGVFKALADPSRRLLLDQLFERDGRTLKELQSQLAMTRFGVMKHLRVLEDASLVTTRKAGREKLHFLNPVPIQLLYDRWIGKYDAARAGALADLKAVLEGGTKMATGVSAKPTLVYAIFISASPQQIWDAITKPEFTSRYFFGAIVKTTGEVGSPINGYAPDGTTLWTEGVVLESDPPRRLVESWRTLYDPAMVDDPPSRVTWEIEEVEVNLSKLTVIHDGFEVETATYKSVSGGWMRVLSAMKTLLETGQPMTGMSA